MATSIAIHRNRNSRLESLTRNMTTHILMDLLRTMQHTEAHFNSTPKKRTAYNIFPVPHFSVIPEPGEPLD